MGCPFTKLVSSYGAHLRGDREKIKIVKKG